MPKKVRRERFPVSPEHQQQVRNRILSILFLAVLIMGLLSVGYYYKEFKGWGSIDSNLNLFLMINLNIILLFLVVLLIVRNLIKLIYERRQKKLGFRLKSKLTVAFMLVSSLPMLLFFFIATGFLRNSLDSWFQGQFSVALKNTSAVITNQEGDTRNSHIHFTQVVLKEYLEKSSLSPVDDKEVNSPWHKELLFKYQLDGMIWHNSKHIPILTNFSDSRFSILWKPLEENLPQDNESYPFYTITQSEDFEIHRVLIHIKLKGEDHYFESVKFFEGLSYVDRMKAYSDLKHHKNLLNLEEPIRATYTTYLLLFTVLMIFGGVWFGYYLARGIVEPIEILVEGTHRISKGDLDFQIDLHVEDEIGMLLDSFNAMTKELQQNRKKLAKSRQELIDTNGMLEARNIFVELILQNIQYGIFLIDNSGFINVINPYLYKLFKLKALKTGVKHYKSILQKEQIVYFEELNELLNDSSDTSIKREYHLTVDKRSIHTSMELFRLTSPKKDPLGRLLVVENLTEIDRSTRARAWGEVARRIAHEIKNPLTPIQLSAQRIRKKYMDQIEDNKLLDSCTATIIDEVYALKNMVNEFSKFARLPEINPAPANINKILENVCNLFEPGLPASVELKLIIDPDLPELMLDEEQIKRVFTNLIDNAVSSISNNGEIIIESSLLKELKMVSLIVSDNGQGIPSHIIPRIFDPYVTTKKEGSGLGLAIAQQIINDHGGFIRLDATKKIGTRFKIELPV